MYVDKLRAGLAIEKELIIRLQMLRKEHKVVAYVKVANDLQHILWQANPKVAKNFSQTVIAGMPDFVVFSPKNKTFFIECKSKKSLLKSEQQQLKKELIDAGFDYIVYRGGELILKSDYLKNEW